jgi:hypothetical protein
MLPLVDGRIEWISLQREVRKTDAGLLASRTDIPHVGEQPALNDWASVIDRVREELAKAFGARGQMVGGALDVAPRSDAPQRPRAEGGR